ncbi:MAG: UDP-N-acetylmuramate dehydrogenase [Sphaerochaetaceae bacterium]|jgi:UDP-N-acetylmuramate dehydrogenase
MNSQQTDEPLIERNVPLAEHTTFKCGGAADYAATPHSLQELRDALAFARMNELPVTVLGGGSNVLVSDRGVRGLVLFTRKLSSCHVRGELLCARCGLSLDKAINISIEHGLTGMELLGGIPGSVGGAVAGNTGVAGMQIGDLLEYVDYLTFDGAAHRLEVFPDMFPYRSSPFTGKNDRIIFEIGFRLAPTNQSSEARLRKEAARTRRKQAGQYDVPSAGCMFKNPSPAVSAGKLIDECDFKGKRLGGARVSPSHANFFLNPDHTATSRDIWMLSEQIRRAVLEKTGFALERELRLIGEWRDEDLRLDGNPS